MRIVTIGSHTPKENVKILTRNESTNRFQVADYKHIHATKGVPVERILKDVMGLPTTRDPEIQYKIDKLWKLIHAGEFDTAAFARQYQEFEDLVGTTDEDVVLMKMEIGRRKWERDSRKSYRDKQELLNKQQTRRKGYVTKSHSTQYDKFRWVPDGF